MGATAIPPPSDLAFEALARTAQLRDAFLDTKQATASAANKRIAQEREAMGSTREKIEKVDTDLAKNFAEQFDPFDLRKPESAEAFRRRCLDRLGQLMDLEWRLVSTLDRARKT